MIRFVLAAALWLSLFMSGYGQSTVTVLSPLQAPAFSREVACITWVDNASRWIYQPAGEWKIQNAAVNVQNQIVAWSEPKTMQLPKGFALLANADNLPKSRAATVWRATEVATGKQLWLTAGSSNGYGAWDDVGDAWGTKQPYPWSGNRTDIYPLIPFASGNAATMPVKEAKGSSPAPPTPNVWIATHPLTECEVAWSYVTHSGETDLSPPLKIPASVNHSTVSGWRRLQLNSDNIGSINLPLGALGRYFYLKINGEWRRQVAKPWLEAEAFVDKYLYAINDLQPILWGRYEGPVHNKPSEPAWSIVTSEQQALYRGENVQVKNNLTVYCPIIIPYKPDSHVIGLTSADGGGYTIEQGCNAPNAPNTHPTCWPLIVVQCADRPSGFYMSGASITEVHPNLIRGPGMSLIVGSCDTFSGQAFNAIFERCTFRNRHHAWASLSTIWKREAVAIGVENTYGGHTASEWKFNQCALSSYRQEHIQSVNFVLRDTTLIGYPATPIKVRDGEAKFYGLIAAKVDTLFEVGSNGRIACRDLFIDQPGVCLLDFTDAAPRSCSIRDTSSTCGFDYLVRSPTNTQPLTINLSDWADYRVDPSDQRSLCYYVNPKKMSFITTNSPLIRKYMKLVPPTLAEVAERSRP